MSTDDANDKPADAPLYTFPHTVQLKHPIKFGKEAIESLTFNRGCLDFIRDMDIKGTPTAGQLMTLAARLSVQPPKVIGMLDPDDSSEVLAVALVFYNACLGVMRMG